MNVVLQRRRCGVGAHRSVAVNVVLQRRRCGVGAHRSALTAGVGARHSSAPQCDSSVYQVAGPLPQAAPAHGSCNHASNSFRVDLAYRQHSAQVLGAGVLNIGCWGVVQHVYRVFRAQGVENCGPDFILMAVCDGIDCPIRTNTGAGA